MSDFSFNINNDEPISFNSDNSKTFELKHNDLQFNKGRAIKSKVMSLPIFSNTIENYGADGAKTIILQELIKMTNDEIIEELEILATISEDNIEIKRSLRAAKLLSFQWLEDRKRSDEIKKKCEFIASVIPTFKIKGNIAGKIKEIKKNISIENQKEKEIIDKDKIKANDISFKVKNTDNQPKPPIEPSKEPKRKSVEGVKIYPNGKILVITDIKGNFKYLRDTLLKYDLIKYSNEKVLWNKLSNTKLIILGDLFNKSPNSSWGSPVSSDSFKVIHLIRSILKDAKNDIFLCVSNYDFKICVGQVFNDLTYGFSGKLGALKSQAQSLPVLISFIENTSFYSQDNLYSIWEEINLQNETFFKLKEECLINGQPNIKVIADEYLLPDISSVKNFLLAIYQEITLPKEKRIKTNDQLKEKYRKFLIEKPGEDLKALLDPSNLSKLLEAILKHTKTIDFLKNFLGSKVKVQTDKGKTLNFFHVSLNAELEKSFSNIKQKNWQTSNFEEALKNSRFIKIKKGNYLKILNSFKDLGFSNIQQFLTEEPEYIFDLINQNGNINDFIPTISPNKMKFAFVSGIKRFQESIISEDKTGILGFSIVDRKNEKDFEDIEMKKISELNKEAKKAYSQKILNDTFGSDRNFSIKIDNTNKIKCQSKSWNLEIDIDQSSALFEDENKAIHVPIKHTMILDYLG